MSEAKELIAVMSNTHPRCYHAKYVGGGELPDELKDQYFTSPDLANAAISKYLEKRGTNNGAARSKSRTN